MLIVLIIIIIIILFARHVSFNIASKILLLVFIYEFIAISQATK